jgi:acyl-coenzyme A thioesterase PaaI-like protein
MITQMKQAHSSSLIRRQPNSKHCFVCGLENEVGLKLRFDDNGVDEVRSTYTVPRHFQGYPGIAHGGIIAAMLDETTVRVAMIADHNRFMMTARMEIKYRKPVPTETPLLLVGRLLKDYGRKIDAHGEIRLPDDSVAAEADITLVKTPAEAVSQDDLNALGWRVYPDEQAAE